MTDTDLLLQKIQRENEALRTKLEFEMLEELKIIRAHLESLTSGCSCRKNRRRATND